MATVLQRDPSLTALLVARLCSNNQVGKARPAVSQRGLGRVCLVPQDIFELQKLQGRQPLQHMVVSGGCRFISALGPGGFGNGLLHLTNSPTIRGAQLALGCMISTQPMPQPSICSVFFQSASEASLFLGYNTSWVTAPLGLHPL